MKKVMVLLLLMLLSVTTAFAAPNERQTVEEEELFKQTITGRSLLSNGIFSFSLDRETGDFTFKDTKRNVEYTANPKNADSDPQADGLGKQWLKSQLLISYYNDAEHLAEVNSFTSSVKQGGLTVVANDKAIRCEYRFEKEGFTVPVEYRLTEEGLQATVPFEQIKEEKGKIRTITLLPYFARVASEEKGMILTPDGCGAVIELTEKEREISTLSYEKTFYGRNPVLTLKQRNATEEDLLFPVFAVSNSEKGLLATVTEGDALTSLNIIGEGNKTGYNAARAVCTIRDSDTVVLYEGTGQELDNAVYQQDIIDRGDFSVLYTPVAGGNDYAALAQLVAKRYSEPLSKSTVAPSSILLETIGVVKKQTVLFGIPVKQDVVLTSPSQVVQISERLKKHGVVDLSVAYYGLYKNGVCDKMPSRGKLGKDIQKDLQKLLDRQIKIFPMADLVRVYKSGNGISALSNTVRNIRGTDALHKPIALQTGIARESEKSYRIANLQTIKTAYQTVAKQNKDNGFSNFGDAGIQLLPSDYTKKRECSRQETLTEYRELMNNIHQKADHYAVEQFYGYMLPFVTDVTRIPLSSSELTAFSYDVPFAQLVLADYVSCYSGLLNTASDPEKAIMKLLEYGVRPSYRVIAGKKSELSDTVIEQEMIGSFEDYEKEIANTYALFHAFFGDGSGRLKSHKRLARGVFISTYTNGKSVIFNYTDEQYPFGDIIIGAGSYREIGGAS